MTEMKDSGINWIGLMPKDWKVISFKHLYSETNSGEVIDKQWWNDGYEILYTCQKTPMLSSFSSFPKWKRTKTNDLLLTRNATPYVFIPDHESIYSNVVQRVKIKYNSNLNYIAYCLKQAADAYGVAAGISIPSYNMEIWNNLKLPMIAKEEQKKIADYLDNKCSQIDSLKSDIQQQISILEQYKKSVITEAVTKGLNPDVEMKDSGIEWIGKIPKDWKVIDIKYLVKKAITDGTHQTPIYDNEINGSPFLSSKDVTSGHIDWSNIKYITQSLHKKLQKEVKPQKNDILLAKNGTTGIAAIVEDDTVFDIYVTLALIRVKEIIVLPKYMLYVINSNICKEQFNEHLIGIGVPNLHLNIINNVSVLIPDSLNEQQQIADYLDTKCSEIDSIIESKQQQLETLEQYKKSLIYEYVTGKKEVK